MADDNTSNPIIPGSSHLNDVPDPKATNGDWQPLEDKPAATPGAQAVDWEKVMADNHPDALPSTGNPNPSATPELGSLDDGANLAQAEEISAPPIANVPLAAAVNSSVDSPMSAPLADIAPQPMVPPPASVPPAAKLNEVTKPKRKAPIALYLILFLLVIILGLTSLVIYLLTGGAASVNLTVDNSSSSQTSTSSGSSTSQTSSTTSTSSQATETDVTFYLLAYGSDNLGGVVDTSTLPKNSIKFGQEDYLVPVLYKQNLATDNPVEEALKGLFAIKSAAYGSQGYKTTTYLSSIQPQVTKLSDGKLQVNLVGNVVFAGDLSPIYFQAQVEQTIKLYTSNYVVQLNGSEQDYKCLSNQSGTCGSSTSSSSSAH